MKRSIIALIFALVYTTSFSQSKLQVSFTDFQAWAKQISIAEYPLLESEQDGSDYTAMLGSGPEKAFQIRLMAMGSFNDYKMISKDAAVYTMSGFKAVNYTYAGTTILTLELPQAQASITFARSGTVPKATMEGLALKSNLQNLKVSTSAANAPGVKWPEMIPADMRVSNVQSISSLGDDGTYKDVIEVKATLNQSLISSVESILKKYNGELSLISTDKLDFICSVAENLPQLKADFKNGETVSFMYYIKK
jgi:hypothetical protein